MIADMERCLRSRDGADVPAETLVPPRDWDALDTGCYMDEALSTLVPLIKDAKPWQRRQVQKDLDSGRRIDHIDAVNAVQRVLRGEPVPFLRQSSGAYETAVFVSSVKDHLLIPDRSPEGCSRSRRKLPQRRCVRF